MLLKTVLFASLWGSGLSHVVRQEMNSTAPATGLPATTTGSVPPGPSETLTTRYIIEVKDPATVKPVVDSVSQADPSAVIVKQWTDDLLPGLCVDSILAQVTIESLEGVQSVWQSKKINPPQPQPGPPPQNNTTPAIRARHVTRRSGLAPFPRRQADNSTYQAENYSDALHRMTGVTQLHKEGVFGAGIKVAVVDDGVYYRHSILGGGFGPGFKVAGGYDFSSSESETGEDEDPAPGIGPFIGHGTHVAGIIAGSNDWFSGVAPNATILAYKIFGRVSPGEEMIIDAWKRAYAEGADVISMSVGSPGGFTDSPLNLLGDRLVERGVVVVVSAGNDGYNGPFYVNEDCSGLKTLCVASVQAEVKPGDPVDITFTRSGQSSTTKIGHVAPGRYPVQYRPTEEGDWNNNRNSMEVYQDIWGIPVPIYSVGDACSSIGPIGANLSETVLLVAQAGCIMEKKVENLVSLGARYVLFYGDGVQSLWAREGLFPESDIRVGHGLIEKDAGDAILSTLNAGGNVTATFNNNVKGFVVPAKHPRGKLASMFSSWGGTYELALKTDIAAPGGDIFSSFAEWMEAGPPWDVIAPSWAVLNGTSMAAPYIAGVAALYLGKHGGRSTNGPGVAKTTIDRIKGSGIHVPWGMEPLFDPLRGIQDPPNPNPVPEGTVAPVFHVGTGLVDAAKVVNYQTSLNFSSIALNDTANFIGSHEVIITNGGSQALSYEFSHDKQLGVEGRTDQQTIAPYTENKMIELSPEIAFPTGDFTVGPGESKTAVFTFTPPTPSDTSKWPFYNGRIVIKSSAGEELAVPYMGAAFDLKKEVGELFPDPPRPDAHTVEQGFEMKWMFNDTVVTGVTINFKLKWGSKYLRLDLFQESWVESAWTWPPQQSAGYVATAVLEGLTTTRLDRTPSWEYGGVINPFTYSWAGRVEQGTLTPGTYRARFALLRPLGDPAVAQDWTVWDTPLLTVIRASV